MANPLYQQFGPSKNQNGGNILEQFAAFKKNFRGDPQQMIQQLLASGRITKEQYDQAVQRATALRQIFGI